MSDVLESIQQRRSIRTFKPQQISKSDLQKIILITSCLADHRLASRRKQEKRETMGAGQRQHRKYGASGDLFGQQ